MNTAKMIVSGCIVVSGLLGGVADADFVLHGTEYLDVTSHHDQAWLYDSSWATLNVGGSIGVANVYDTARLGGGGQTDGAATHIPATPPMPIHVHEVYAYNNSSVDLQGYRAGSVNMFDSTILSLGSMVISLSASGNSIVVTPDGGVTAYGPVVLGQSSRITIRGGLSSDYPEGLSAYGNSSVEITGGVSNCPIIIRDASSLSVSGGEVLDVIASGASAVQVSGGHVNQLYSEGDTTVVSGGTIGALWAGVMNDVSVLDGVIELFWMDNNTSGHVFGGSIGCLGAMGHSQTSLHGYDFQGANGVWLEGERVLGTGVLSGRWFDGTPWTMTIEYNDPEAMLIAVPEPTTLLLLVIGGLGLIRRRR